LVKKISGLYWNSILIQSSIIFMFLKIFILVPAFCQSNIRLIGHVYDASDGRPLNGAIIKVTGSYFYAISDDEGQFYIENISPGVYDVVILLLGYEPQKLVGIIVSEDQPTRLEVALIPKPFTADSVVVLAEDEKTQGEWNGASVILSGVEIRRYDHLGLTNLLQQVAGIQVESMGGAGSKMLVRIHGSRSNQVLVLLDGQRLNNPQTGEVDLSEIPVEQIERIEIYRQGDAAAIGSQAFDGAIAFYTKRIDQTNRINSQLYFGSFETASGKIGTELGGSKLGLLTNYSQDFSRQNFKYSYEGQTHERKNAWCRNRKIFSKLNYQSTAHQFSFLFNSQSSRRGLPSAFFNEQNPFAANVKESVQAMQFRHHWMLAFWGMLESHLAYHRLSQIFDNKEAPRKVRYWNSQKNETWEFNTRGRFQPNQWLDGFIGMEFMQEKLNQENLLYPAASIGEKVRRIQSYYQSLHFSIQNIPMLVSSLHLRETLRYEKIFEKRGRWFPSLGVSLVPYFWQQLNISANWSEAVRYPDFNSLFWKGDARARGNPDLSPEQKRSWSVGLRVLPKNSKFPEINWFLYSEKIDNLIFWHRSFDGVWEPRNEERVEKRGWDLEVNQSLLSKCLQIQAAYSYIDAVNKKNDPVIYNKRVVFIPKNTLNISVWANYNKFTSHLNYRYVSDRETTVSNSKGTQIAPYQIWDFTLNHYWKMNRVEIDIGLTLKNIFNENYQLIMGYPMPGRAYFLTIHFKTFIQK